MLSRTPPIEVDGVELVLPDALEDLDARRYSRTAGAQAALPRRSRMKRFSLLVLALVALLVAPSFVFAQQTGSPVYLVPSISYSSTPYVTATPSDSNTVNKQLTVTITPPTGQAVYVTGWDFSACNDNTGTAVLSNGAVTTTGFQNLPKVTAVSSAGTANTCAAPVFMNLGAFPMRGPTSTAVAFVSPPANAHIAYTLNLYAITGP